jgi:hypothetical protein
LTNLPAHSVPLKVNTLEKIDDNIDPNPKFNKVRRLSEIVNAIAAYNY